MSQRPEVRGQRSEVRGLRTAKDLVTKMLTKKVISLRNRGIDMWSINKRWFSEVWLDSTEQAVSRSIFTRSAVDLIMGVGGFDLEK